MVVRLKDLRSGQTSEKKSGVVRLADIRKQEQVKQVESYKAADKKFNPMMSYPSRPFVAPVSSSVSLDPSQSPVMQDIKKINTANDQKNAEIKAEKAKNTNYEKRKNDPSRKIPILKYVFKGLDKFSDTKTQHVIADVGQTLYTPGGTVANIAGFTGAVGKKLAEKAPNLVGSTAGRIAQTAIKEAAVGAPLGVGQSLATGHDGKDAVMGGVYGAALGGGLGGAGSALVQGAKAAVNSSVSKIMGNVFEAINKVGNEVKPLKLKVSSPEEAFQSVIPKVFKDATERMTPPLENERALAKWVQTHLNESGYNSSLKEVENLGYEKLRTISEDIRKEFNVSAVAKQSADDLGYGQIYNKETPTIKQVQAADESARAYGFPAPKVEIQRGNFKGPSTNEFPTSKVPESAAPVENIAPPVSKVKRLDEIRAEAAAKEATLNSEVKPVETEVDDLIKTKEPRIRDKVYNLLDEQEKAARARLATKKNTLSSLPLDQYADHAVILAAKIGKGGIKLADATEYLVKEFGESIRPHAQAILAKSREVVRVAERKATKEGLEAEAFNNSGLGDSKSFESKITRGKKSDKKTFGERWEKSKTQFIEDIAPLNKLERDVTGKISSAEKSFYKTARNYKGVPEKINQFIDERLKPIVRRIEKLGYHSDDLGRYALAKHAKDVNKAGMKSGFTNAEIDDVINKLGTAEMETARKELVSINKELLDDLVESGVISSNLRDTLNERWKNYIPLHRDLDDVVGRSSGLSEALANVASPIKRLKGSEKNVVEPLENMVENIVKNINAAERNKVASHITKLSKLDPDAKFIRKLKDGEKTEGKNVVSVKINGENVHYEVEPEVMKAILTLDKESSNALMRFLSVPASWLRAGATLTPEFIIRNPIRDYRNARIVSESGFRITDYAVGLASSLMGKFGKGKLYQDWVKNLGAYGNIVSEDRNVFLASQKKVLTQSTTKKFVNVINPKSIISLLRSISDISESSTKVGEYRAALRKGATKEEAAYRSRDIMDFARAGTSIRQTNKVVAFLNANIQGKSKMIRAFKNDPVGTSVRIFKSMAIPTAGFYYYNKYFANDQQKETIKNAPNWQRNTFWLVAVPGTDMVARIPKPFDFAVVANVVERSLDFFDGNDKESFDNFGKGVITDNALPMMITGIQPLIEGMANHSFFKDAPIVPVRDQGVEFKDQYDPIRTSEAAKGIAKGVESIPWGLGGNFRSPYVVDNTIQGLFAGGGKYATDAIDAILGGIGAAKRPKAPEKSAEQKPVLRSFLIDPNQGGTAMDQIYTLKDKLTREEGSAKRREEAYKDSDKLDYVTDQTKEMSLIGAAIRSIEKSMELSPKQKREKIDDLNKQRNDIAKQTMKRIKEVEGK